MLVPDLTVVGTRSLPDISHSLPGRGFTITGLARARDGSIWAANDGRIVQEDGSGYRPSLIHLAADWTHVLAEVPLPFDSSVQGLAIVKARLWFILPTARMVASIPIDRSAGYRLELRTAFEPNGLAYDPERDLLYIGSEKGKRIIVYSLGLHGVVASRTLGFGPDQLLMSRYGLLATTGRSGEPGHLVLLTETMREHKRWRLREVRAIEGILISPHILSVANDSYFHRTEPHRKEIVEYRMPEGL